MNYLTTIHSDVGIKKQVNQDSCLVIEADTDFGPALLCVMCDGMGGLSKGELASAAVIKAFSAWFKEEFPVILNGYFTRDAVFSSWENLLTEMNSVISEYGMSQQIRLGTTACAALFIGNEYFIVNVGDSRAYQVKHAVVPLTHDQSFVQLSIDAGLMTKEEALKSDKRSVLLYCIGANSEIQPDFYSGSFDRGELYLLCSDGFVHTVPEQEMFGYLNPNALNDETSMKNAAIALTELNKQRRESDNISVILIKVV